MVDNYDYYKLRIQRVSKSVSREVEFFSNTPYADVGIIGEYLAIQKSRLTNDRADKKNNKYESSYVRPNIVELDPKTYVNELELHAFNKEWTKLRPFHRTMKIKEYVKELEYNKSKRSPKVSQRKIDSNRKHIQHAILQGLKEKKFGKNKCQLNYNPEKMKIESIECVFFDKNTGLYEVDWD